MKIKRKWLAQLASWGLALGCGLTSLPTAQGQNYLRFGDSLNDPPLTNSSEQKWSVLNSVQENRVQCAWLADPATFCLNLKIQCLGSNLCVVGAVPNAKVKERVLDLAQKQLWTRPSDSMTVIPGIYQRLPAHVAAEELELRVRRLLKTSAPEIVNEVQIRADHKGLVILSGRVKSFEEQLTVCRMLRALPECAAVVSQLNLDVAGTSPEAKISTVKPKAANTSDAVVVVVTHPIKSINATSVLSITSPVQTIEPVAVAPGRPAGNTLDVASVVAVGPSTFPKIQWDGPPTLPAMEAAQPLLAVKEFSRPALPTVGSDKIIVPVSSWETKGSCDVVSQPLPLPPGPPLQAKAGVKQVASKLPESKILDLASTKVPQDLGPPYITTAQVCYWESSAGKTLPQQQPAQEVHEPKTLDVSSSAPAVQPGSPSLLLPLPAEPNGKTPPPALAGKLSVPQIEALVLKRCGQELRNLAVRYLPDGKVEVALDVANEKIGSMMYDRIVSIPEFGALVLWVKIQVVQK